MLYVYKLYHLWDNDEGVSAVWDTIGLSSTIKPLTREERNRINWAKTGTYEDHDRYQQGVTVFKILGRKSKDKGVPYIRYVYNDSDPAIAYIKVEVSMPTFLYGSNVKEITEQDVKKFFKRLRRYLADRLGIPIRSLPKSGEWTVTKLHACKNFYVGDNVQHYLQHFSLINRQKYQTKSYKEVGSSVVETVEWQAKGRKEKVYDKEKDISKQKKYKDQKKHRKQAKGILRYEVELSRQELYAQHKKRRSKYILTKAFADEVLNKGLTDMGMRSNFQISGLRDAYDRIINSDLSNRKKTTLIALLFELHEYGVKQTKRRQPDSTYSRNIAILKKVLGTDKLVFNPLNLPPLIEEIKADTTQPENEKSLSI